MTERQTEGHKQRQEDIQGIQKTKDIKKRNNGRTNGRDTERQTDRKNRQR